MHNPSRREATRLILVVAVGLFAPTFLAADTLPLAIRGYDPVAYFTTRTPTPGLPEIELEWDEHRYRFSRPEHRELFKADPVRYAPQFANFCAMALAKGQIVEADPKAWLISDGKLYIFGGPDGPRLFQQSLAENVAKANQNRMLVENLQR
ncbi:YHS domain-containing (seleno)protein [Microvirga pakistanensis]|uniref:YHS domain-containing (seleno)protein n=1 Tax=Microvirga pakistanensis TaxID=1682650 RepID=UPI00106ACBF6|nr:YHS domain-containing (seleno)protein [Microvirga pakistanensis]